LFLKKDTEGDDMNIVIGCNGEVGSAVKEFFTRIRDEVLGVDIGTELPKTTGDVLHICIPYTDRFVETVLDYKNKLKPSMAFVYSTVPIGTTKKLGKEFMHSPIEGRHPHILDGFEKFVRFVAGPMSESGKSYFEVRGLRTIAFSTPEVTEAGKLFSTLRYGVNLMLADEMKEICDMFFIRYDDAVKKYVEEYNKYYQDKGISFPILEPPKGKIGGHCVVNNANLLLKTSKSQFAESLSKFNSRGSELSVKNLSKKGIQNEI
jgi:hypothetical protein